MPCTPPVTMAIRPVKSSSPTTRMCSGATAIFLQGLFLNLQSQARLVGQAHHTVDCFQWTLADQVKRIEAQASIERFDTQGVRERGGKMNVYIRVVVRR